LIGDHGTGRGSSRGSLPLRLLPAKTRSDKKKGIHENHHGTIQLWVQPQKQGCHQKRSGRQPPPSLSTSHRGAVLKETCALLTAGDSMERQLLLRVKEKILFSINQKESNPIHG